MCEKLYIFSNFNTLHKCEKTNWKGILPPDLKKMKHDPHLIVKALSLYQPTRPFAPTNLELCMVEA
jgi:hypothetical protein